MICQLGEGLIFEAPYLSWSANKGQALRDEQDHSRADVVRFLKTVMFEQRMKGRNTCNDFDSQLLDLRSRSTYVDVEGIDILKGTETAQGCVGGARPVLLGDAVAND